MATLTSTGSNLNPANGPTNGPTNGSANGGKSVSIQQHEPVPVSPPFTVADAERLYAIREWGGGYFGVNAEGHLCVMPERDPKRQIDLHEVIEGLREREIGTPVIIRLRDLLKHRLTEIREAFDNAIKEHQYTGSYC
ncbi:MAG: hypothetical protein ACK58T_08165, partial [Phycisphaerae bacterium]